MEAFTPSLITLISSAVVLLQVLLVVGLLAYLFLNKNPLDFFPESLRENLIPAAFIVTLAMAAMTLYFEYVAGFEPCMLCWWQRVCMFPQLILFGVAWFKKDASVVLYSLVLSGIGLLIGLYNYALLFVPSLAPCSAAGVSCTKIYFLEFGYVTFPMWAITGFLLLIVLMVLERSKSKI